MQWPYYGTSFRAGSKPIQSTSLQRLPQTEARVQKKRSIRTNKKTRLNLVFLFVPEIKPHLTLQNLKNSVNISPVRTEDSVFKE
ncbi:MAG: hypothetical protein HZA94_03425 [Candidatus Vogelbacteria bacterium]|nr:hypothetical protein [Candidatus Vogelbacteria bacterium]